MTQRWHGTIRQSGKLVRELCSAFTMYAEKMIDILESGINNGYSYAPYVNLLIRPDKLDLLFLISHFLDLGAGGRLLFITSLFNLISDFLCRRRFRDRSAVLSTKLGSTLLRKPIAMVSLHRQRTSRRQRASHLHLLVNGDVYGSRIPGGLSHVTSHDY